VGTQGGDAWGDTAEGRLAGLPRNPRKVGDDSYTAPFRPRGQRKQPDAGKEVKSEQAWKRANPTGGKTRLRSG